MTSWASLGRSQVTRKHPSKRLYETKKMWYNKIEVSNDKYRTVKKVLLRS